MLCAIITLYDTQAKYKMTSEKYLQSIFANLFLFDMQNPLDIHPERNQELNKANYERLIFHRPLRLRSSFQLQAQITREFRHFSIYLGGENLTNYTISTPIRGASDPWGPAFDATQVWGPVNGAMGYIGIRYKLESF